MFEKIRYQPGWATPIMMDYDRPSLIARFLGLGRGNNDCLARRQGKCPGLDQCHDCTWSRQSSSR